MHRPTDPRTVDELWDDGVAALTPDARGHLLGGASDGCGMRRNRRALEDVAFVPRVVGGSRPVDTTARTLGATVAAPIGTAPIGSVDLATPRAAEAILDALAEQELMGYVGLLAIDHLRAMPDLRAAAAMLQLYLRGDDTWLREVLGVAEDRGFHGFCVTVDSREKAYRPTDRRNRYVKREVLGRAANLPDDPHAYDHQRAVDWSRLERLRTMTERPLVIKGLVDVGEARRAVDVGFDGVYISNHGGRNLGHAISTAEALDEIAGAVPSTVALVVDGGFRDAEDVIKGLCLGADLVTFGRSHFLALAADGAAGLTAFFGALREQLEVSMRLLGASSLGDLDRSFLRIGPPWQSSP